MSYIVAPPITLMQFWRLYSSECRLTLEGESK